MWWQQTFYNQWDVRLPFSAAPLAQVTFTFHMEKNKRYISLAKLLARPNIRGGDGEEFDTFVDSQK